MVRHPPKSLLCLALWTLLAIVARAEPIAIPTEKIRDQGASSGAPRFYMLAVGISNFDDDFWPRLKWTENDAQQVARTFGEGTGLKRIVTRLSGSTATLAGVRQALKTLEQQARRQDIVAIYFSTHGTLVPAPGNELRSVLVLRDSRAAALDKTTLSHDELRGHIQSMRAAKKLLVLASCHSGVGKSRLTPRVQELLAGQKGVTPTESFATVSEGTLVIGAAAQSESAREDDALRSDIYTHYFVEALSVYDRNKDGQVTALEAHDYAKERTFTRTAGRQRATVEAQLIGDADVPLAGQRQRSGLPVLEAYGDDLAGLQLRTKGAGKANTHAIDLPSAVPLADGVNRIELLRAGDDKPIYVYKLHASPGDRIAIDDVLVGPPWSVRLGGGLVSFTDERAKRLAGSSPTVIALTGARRFGRHFNLGLEMNLVRKASHHVRPLVAVNFEEYGFHLVPGFLQSITPHISAHADLHAGRHTGTLTIADDSGIDATETLSRTSNAYGIGIGLEYDFFYGFGIDTSLRYIATSFAFDDFGSLTRNRVEALLTLRFAFGGVGMRVPP